MPTVFLVIWVSVRLTQCTDLPIQMEHWVTSINRSHQSDKHVPTGRKRVKTTTYAWTRLIHRVSLKWKVCMYVCHWETFFFTLRTYLCWRFFVFVFLPFSYLLACQVACNQSKQSKCKNADKHKVIESIARFVCRALLIPFGCYFPRSQNVSPNSLRMGLTKTKFEISVGVRAAYTPQRVQQ